MFETLEVKKKPKNFCSAKHPGKGWQDNPENELTFTRHTPNKEQTSTMELPKHL